MPTGPVAEKTAPLRVLHLAHSSAWSGGEISLLRLIDALDEREVSSVLVCAEDGRLADNARRRNVSTLVEPLSAGIRERRRRQVGAMGTLALVPELVAYARRLARLARSQRIDVIHTNSLKAFVYGAIAGRLAGVPVIAHLRDDLGHLQAGVTGAVVRSLLRRLPKAVVGCSSYVLTAARMRPPRSHVVYSGIPRHDVVGRANPRPDPPVVGMVARMALWKGQHLFLEAAAQVAVRQPDVRFRLIGAPMFGEEGYVEELRRRCQEEPLAGRVEFTGLVQDPRPEYDQLTVAVAASVTPEPFGNVIIEAMARGVPVVAPAEGGPAEILTDGVDGVLVPPRDPDAIAAAILELLESPETAAAMADRAAATTADRFTIEQGARRFMEIVREVAS
jgi:glycosyltransferase involved in cell wall biosynthesis